MESMEEMRHADWLIKRILFLDGLPNVQRLNQVLIGQTVKEVLECDSRLEQKAIADLKDGIAHCESVRDYVSRDLLLKILADEEKHEDFLHAQFTLIERIGEERVDVGHALDQVSNSEGAFRWQRTRGTADVGELVPRPCRGEGPNLAEVYPLAHAGRVAPGGASQRRARSNIDVPA